MNRLRGKLLHGATKVNVQYGTEANGSFAHCPPGQVAVGGGTPDGWFAKVTGGKPAVAFVLRASP